MDKTKKITLAENKEKNIWFGIRYSDGFHYVDGTKYENNYVLVLETPKGNFIEEYDVALDEVNEFHNIKDGFVLELWPTNNNVAKETIETQAQRLVIMGITLKHLNELNIVQDAYWASDGGYSFMEVTIQKRN